MMPETKVSLNEKTNKKVRLYMASHNIKNKGKAIQEILKELHFDYSEIEESKNANI